MMANEHITKGRNWYEKVETIKHLGSLLTSGTSIHEEINVDLKQEIRVIILAKHFCLLEG